MSQVNLEELKTLIARHAKAGETTTAWPGLVLSAFTLPTEPAAYLAEPGFALVVQGAKRVVLGDQVFDYGAGQYLVYSVDLPLIAHVSAASPDGPLLGLGLRLKPQAIAALLLESGSPRSGKLEQRGIAVSSLTTDLVDPIIRLLRLLDHPRDIAVLGPAVEREILWRLIQGEQGAMVRQLGLADSRMAQVGRAIRWIRVHYAKTIRVEELAAAAGMSATSLHRHFRTVTAMSPIQFQKRIRLDTARSRLLSTGDDVADVGFAVGYGSPSQFSREYRRRFGKAPGGERSEKAAKPRSLDADTKRSDPKTEYEKSAIRP